MKKVIIEYEENKKELNPILEWLIYVIGYAFVLIIVSIIFKNTIYIDTSLFGVWAVLTVIIIYILNKTIKPIIVLLTLPITVLTLGLFYPIVNVIILNIADFILGKHFEINGLFIASIVAIIISFMNMLMDKWITNPIIERVKK